MDWDPAITRYSFWVADFTGSKWKKICIMIRAKACGYWSFALPLTSVIIFSEWYHLKQNRFFPHSYDCLVRPMFVDAAIELS
jgi:hypothetical protein